jgi:galactokinase
LVPNTARAWLETRMSERIEKLKSIVRELESELAALDSVDPESQRVLEEAVADLTAALGKTDSDAFSAESLVDSFRAVEESFAVSHPTLSGIVARVIHGLGQLGI